MRGISETKVISRVRRQKNGKKFIWAVLMVLLLQFLAVEGLIICNGESDPEAKTDYVIILGAGLNGDVPSISLSERLSAGAEYLKKYPDAIAVVSGGQGRGETVTEAEAMKKYLVSEGIAEERILTETRAASTMDNFRLSRELIESKTGKKLREVTFVTNSFHILRAKMLAGRNGLIAHAVAPDKELIVIPSYIREYFALIKSYIIDR